MVLAGVLFGLTYVSLIAFPRYRAAIAPFSAVLFVALGILPLKEVPGVIDWNVLLMIGGAMGIVSLFIESGMPNRLADILIERVPDLRWAVISLAVFAGVISAFVDNVATVLMVAPVAMSIARKLKLKPVPILIAIAISSNLQGAATLVGDTTSIMLGSHAHMDFLDFFVYRGKPGLFFIVELGAVAATLILMVMFRREKEPLSAGERTEVRDYFPTVLLCGMITLLIGASFLKEKPAVTNGLICVGLFLAGLVREMIRGRMSVVKQTFRSLDGTTLLMLAGLFVVIGGVTEAGIIRKIADLFLRVGGDSLFVSYTLIVWFSVLVSAFIDNIPYVATMLPVVGQIAANLGVDPTPLYFGLLIGATLGGNITPIGASANITAIGILEKNGERVKPADFMKMGIPFTLAAVVTGYGLTWLLFGM